MNKKLKSRRVVFVGGGLMAGLAARQLTATASMCWCSSAAAITTHGAEHRLPSQRDELRWDMRNQLGAGLVDRDLHAAATRATRRRLPIRRLEAFLPGEGVGGAGNHWNGHSLRWAEYDPQLRTRLVDRYGETAIPHDMPIQDWGVTYDEIEPYHDDVREAVRHRRQGRQYARADPGRRQSVRGAAPRASIRSRRSRSPRPA